jgi:hypothetical protein
MERGAGGTPGGILEFFIGAAMIVGGGILFFRRLMVTSSFRVMWGQGGSGIALLILLFGIGVVFFSGRSRIGWALIVIGLLMIVFSVITNLVVYFMPTSLFETIVMLGLIFGGLGLVARSLRPHNVTE